MIINYSDQEVVKGEKSIFLAGPTPRTKDIISWRKKACAKLEALGFDGVVYVPELTTGGIRDGQEVWEREALTLATVIAFWIPRHLPDMPGFTTNVEFGYWLHSNKVIYGRPDHTIKTGYLDWLYNLDYGLEPFNNLDELLKGAIEKCSS